MRCRESISPESLDANIGDNFPMTGPHTGYSFGSAYARTSRISCRPEIMILGGPCSPRKNPSISDSVNSTSQKSMNEPKIIGAYRSGQMMRNCFEYF